MYNWEKKSNNKCNNRHYSYNSAAQITGNVAQSTIDCMQIMREQQNRVLHATYGIRYSSSNCNKQRVYRLHATIANMFRPAGHAQVLYEGHAYACNMLWNNNKNFRNLTTIIRHELKTIMSAQQQQVHQMNVVLRFMQQKKNVASNAEYALT